MQDYQRNQNIYVDYESIDEYARSQNIQNLNREELTHEVIGYLPYWEYNHYPNLDYGLLTQINYFSAELDPYGNIINDHNWENLYLIDYAHERNVKVKLCATLFGQNELSILLSNPENRENAIQNLLSLVVSMNADGIDIDFELLPNSQRENLVLFMQELSEAFNSEMNDPIITMATPAVDWSNAWDYASLAAITDGLFIMGYNYFYSGSSNAGPVSPLGGYYYDLEFTVDDYIEKTQNQLDKIILGLPYYGYDWPVQDNIINSETTGYGSARFYEESVQLFSEWGYNVDNQSNSQWIPYESELEWRQSWYDDSLSLSIKYQFAIDKDLAGVGIWALGYDNGYDELWGAIYDKFIYSLLGDLNNDTLVNVVDIVLLVNIVLGTIENFNEADLTDDGLINILDIVVLISIILNRY